MFRRYFKVEAPKGLSEEQMKFWKERFVPALSCFDRFDFKYDSRSNITLDMYREDLSGLHSRLENRWALEAGEWFITQLMMDPVTKVVGPLFNKPENYPQLITATGRFSFCAILVEANPVHVQLLLSQFEFEPVSQ